MVDIFLPEPKKLSDKTGDFREVFGPHTLAQRPEHAALIAVIISKWSFLENGYTDILCSLVGSRSVAVVDLYNNNRDFTKKNNALRDIVRSEQDVILDYYMSTIHKNAISLSGMSNRFCHDIFGFVMNDPSIILCVKSNFLAYSENWFFPDEEKYEINRSVIYMFDVGVLKDIISAIDRLLKGTNLIFSYLRSRHIPSSEGIKVRLFHELSLLFGRPLEDSHHSHQP